MKEMERTRKYAFSGRLHRSGASAYNSDPQKVHHSEIHTIRIIIILILQLSVSAYVRKSHPKLFDPSPKTRFVCICEL